MKMVEKVTLNFFVFNKNIQNGSLISKISDNLTTFQVPWYFSKLASAVLSVLLSSLPLGCFDSSQLPVL